MYDGIPQNWVQNGNDMKTDSRYHSKSVKIANQTKVEKKGWLGK